jgi:signal transduction histidine kinase
MDAASSVARAPPVRPSRHQLAVIGCGVLAVAVAAASAAIAISGPAEHVELVALARGLIVGVPVAVGLGAWLRDPSDRFGLVLAATGAAWSVTTLAESGDELLYTLGRTAGWLVEVLIIYLILSFPTGRLSNRVDRVLVGAVAVVVLTLFLPRLVLAADFPVPSPFTSCTAACPENAFFLPDHEPAFVDAVLRPAGALAVIAVMVAVLMRLWERIRAATPLARRLFWPVLVVAVARIALLGVAFVLREADPGVWSVEVAAWLLAFALPAIALAILFATIRSHLFAAHAVEQLAGWLDGVRDAGTFRRAFADALHDPTLQIVFPMGGARDGWVDPSGRPVKAPDPGDGRALSEVVEHGTIVAGVIHDEALRIDPQVAKAGLAIAAVALDNHRLAHEASAATREVRRSRARIATSAEQERRRIERDLHDGAQQRLVALRIELQLAEELVRRDPDQGAARLQELEHDLDETLEDLRSLAHGVFPPLLADRGLADALSAVARRSPVRVDMELNEVGRYPPEVESAVYFCVVEALQNALKHGAGAHRIAVRIDGAGGVDLRFTVRDDGAGAPGGEVTPGVGITNMRDRLATIAGALDVSSTPGVGTTVRGRVPVSGQSAV